MIVRWAKKLGLWGWTLVTIVTLVIVVAGLIFRKNNGVETMISNIRAAGEPVTLAELEAMLLAVAPKRDATELWIEGFDLIDRTGQPRFAKLPFSDIEKPVDPPPPGSDWPELALAEEYLADYAEALKRFHEASELGGPARLAPVHDPFSFDYRLTFEAARLLLVESHVHAHKGQAGPTLASLQAAFAVGKALEGIPSPTAFVVHRNVEASATAQLLRLLPYASFSDDQLASLQWTLRAIDHRRELLHALFGERVTGIRIMKDPTLLRRGPPLGAVSTMVYPLTRDASMRRYVGVMRNAVAAGKLPWPEALVKARKIDNRKSTPPYYARLGPLIAPPVYACIHAATRGVARGRMADLALAAQRYRLAHGRLPAAIDDLAPDFLPSIPLDPFTDEPLHYLPTDDGFVVYSVAADRKDNGGPLEAFRTREPDFGYRVRYPKAAADVSTE